MQKVEMFEMNEKVYPALYRATDLASIRSQKRYLILVASYSIILILATGLAVYGIQEAVSAIIAAVLIIISTFTSLFMIFIKDEDKWYRTRAVAESVKTITWRFMMRADPFGTKKDVNDVKTQFRELLRKILKEHKDLAHELRGRLCSEEQITESMCYVRDLALKDRIEIYRIYRIDEQRKWYEKKSTRNKKHGQYWFGVLILCQLIAIILVICRVAYPNWEYWPSEIFVVSAGATLTWIQVKRFQEVSAAYGITAHEVGIIRGELESVFQEKDFAQFIIDSENAFSREHTQWLARKDVL